MKKPFVNLTGLPIVAPKTITHRLPDGTLIDLDNLDTVSQAMLKNKRLWTHLKLIADCMYQMLESQEMTWDDKNKILKLWSQPNPT